MKTWTSTSDLATNDLSLALDGTGRLWKFRPTTAPHGKQPVDAHLTDEGVVVTVNIEGLGSGDVDLCANGDVLEIRGRVDRTMHLACDVQMLEPVALSTITTDYTDEVLFITVPPAALESDHADAVPECMPVAL